MVWKYAMAGPNPTQMARTRALLTGTERDYITQEVDVEENKRYQAISRVRDRFDELEKDVEALAEHHPELLEEIQEIVCTPGGTTDD